MSTYVVSKWGATPEPHQYPDCPPPVVPVPDARATLAPVLPLVATSESGLEIIAWSPTKIPARRKPKLLWRSPAYCEKQTGTPKMDRRSASPGITPRASQCLCGNQQPPPPLESAFAASSAA